MPADFVRLPDVLIGSRSFVAPLVMGVLNVTPDSFSDGGVHSDPADYALGMAAKTSNKQLFTKPSRTFSITRGRGWTKAPERGRIRPWQRVCSYRT
jgi:hypothetical protein